MCCTVSWLMMLSRDECSIISLLSVHEDEDSEDDVGSVAASIIFLLKSFRSLDTSSAKATNESDHKELIVADGYTRALILAFSAACAHKPLHTHRKCGLLLARKETSYFFVCLQNVAHIGKREKGKDGKERNIVRQTEGKNAFNYFCLEEGIIWFECVRRYSRKNKERCAIKTTSQPDRRNSHTSIK